MKKVIFGIILTVATIGVFGAMKSINKDDDPIAVKEATGYKVGDIATDFNLKNVDGLMVSLAGIKNTKGYIVTFTSNVCPFAVKYEDRLIALHNEFAPRGHCKMISDALT